ncbi:glycerol-3-phosphate 1-O-acyltransferase PlsY [candidate division TA06 bacterium]|nr:glycerol-3-phosphate 1-O-acyltransferase PlsY [candidate division TA06 bacterium]
METLLRTSLAFLLSFGIGSLPFGYWIPKLSRGMDIRRLGSGNVGTSNVFRVMGWKGGVLVLILDLTKGFLPTLLAGSFWGLNLSILVGLGAVLGHIFTPILGFKGGKGVATGSGAFLAIAPLAVFLAFGIWLLILFLFRYVSLASLIASLSVPLLLLAERNFHIGEYSLQTFTLSLLVMMTVFLRHLSNLKRLFRGEELKFQFKMQNAK